MKVSIRKTGPLSWLLEVNGQIRVIRPSGQAGLQLEHVEGDDWELVEYPPGVSNRHVHLRSSNEALMRTLLRLIFRLKEGRARTVESREDGGAHTLGTELDLGI